MRRRRRIINTAAENQHTQLDIQLEEAGRAAETQMQGASPNNCDEMQADVER